MTAGISPQVYDSDMADNNSPTATPSNEKGLGLIVTGFGLLGFGLMMAFMALAYTRDLSMLQDAPGALWSALCGQPVKSDLTQPVLLAASVAGLLAGIVLLIAGRLRRRLRSRLRSQSGRPA